MRYYQKRQKKTKKWNRYCEYHSGMETVNKSISGVSFHSFYRELPYEVLEERKKGTFKKHCIGNEKVDAKQSI